MDWELIIMGIVIVAVVILCAKYPVKSEAGDE